MVIAYHVIITAYGFWLPNDLRGSGSDFVRRPELLPFGKATPVQVRHSVASAPLTRDQRATRFAAKNALTYPPVRFNQAQTIAIADGFADGVRRSGFVFYACAILPDHSHLVIGRHSYQIEQVANRLKGSASRILSERGIHPMAGARDARGRLPSPWSAGLRKVFLNTPGEVIGRIRYARDNLTRAGLPEQNWAFVREYRQP
jgi:hypothetical protein